jgi:hypothetical protein
VGFGLQLLIMQQQQQQQQWRQQSCACDTMIAFREYIKPEMSMFNVAMPRLYLHNCKFHFE